MDIKKIGIESKILDVIPIESYVPGSYPGKVAVEYDGRIYPERNKTEEASIGIYNYNWGSKLVGMDNLDPAYNASNAIDFKSENIKELIVKMNDLKDIERKILTDPEDVFIPPLLDNDRPEMRGLKEAVIAKNIDIMLYEDAFNGTFTNDVRLFKLPNISFGKFVSTCDALDIKATLILEDKSPTVPNPIGEPVVKVLTGGGNYDE